MIRSFILGSTLALVMASPVLAGPCTEQISDLQKVLASSDAGSGPTLRIFFSAFNHQLDAAASGRHGCSSLRDATAGTGSRRNAADRGHCGDEQDDARQGHVAARCSRAEPGAANGIADGSGRHCATPGSRSSKFRLPSIGARSADQAGDASCCSDAVNQAKSIRY